MARSSTSCPGSFCVILLCSGPSGKARQSPKSVDHLVRAVADGNADKQGNAACIGQSSNASSDAQGRSRTARSAHGMTTIVLGHRHTTSQPGPGIYGPPAVKQKTRRCGSMSACTHALSPRRRAQAARRCLSIRRAVARDISPLRRTP